MASIKYLLIHDNIFIKYLAAQLYLVHKQMAVLLLLGS